MENLGLQLQRIFSQPSDNFRRSYMRQNEPIEKQGEGKLEKFIRKYNVKFPKKLTVCQNPLGNITLNYQKSSQFAKIH